MPATLGAYHWRLADATNTDGQRIEALFARADQPLQLDFAAGQLAISNSCNRMRGSWSLDGDKLTTGQFASTLMACNDPRLAALDAAVGRYLAGALTLAVQPGSPEPQLHLTTAQGDILAFDGEPTAETRYGSQGETRFLEIAAQTKSCTGAADATCLEARELHYDANGLRAGQPGPWHMLDQDIEGYTHQPGVRNVLRVKRYRLADTPAGSSSVAYVLDMVVESQR